MLDRRALLAACPLLLPGAAGATPFQQRGPGVRSLRFELELDPGAARAVEWGDDGTGLEVARGLVERRLLALGRAARVSIEGQHVVVELPSILARDREQIGGLLTSLGTCEFLFLVDGASAGTLGIDLLQETRKLETWHELHAQAGIAAFNALAEADGGPHPRLAWGEAAPAEAGPSGRPRALLLPDRLEDCLGRDCIASARVTEVDGSAALAVELVPERRVDLERISSEHVGWQIALVVGSRIRATPTVRAPMGASFVIEGGFPRGELESLSASLSGGNGPLRLVER